MTDITEAPITTIPADHASKRHKLGNPFAYFKKCLRLYADARGRAGVAEYWSFTLVSTLLYLLPLVLMVPSLAQVEEGGEPGALFLVGAILLLVVALGLILPGITVVIRRMHDIGMSGWWLLLIVPLYFVYIGSLILLVISLIPSSDKANKHGPSPKHPEADLRTTFA